MPRRGQGNLGEAPAEDELHLADLDRTDGRHRRQLGEERLHPIGSAQRSRGEGGKAIEPFAPRRLVRERGELVEEGQGKSTEALEIGALAQDAFHPCVAGFLEIGELELELAPQAIEATFPPVAASDHRRLDEQLFPAPRCPQRAGLDGSIRCRMGIVLEERPRFLLLGLPEQRDELVVRRHPAFAGGRGGRRRSLRGRKGYLAERKVLGEPPRREPFGGAGEEREERPAGGVGLQDAASEPGRHSGAAEGFFEERPVGRRRSQ